MLTGKARGQYQQQQWKAMKSVWGTLHTCVYLYVCTLIEVSMCSAASTFVAIVSAALALPLLRMEEERMCK